MDGPRFKRNRRSGLFLNLHRHKPIRIVDSESGAVIVITLDRQGKLNINAPQRFVVEKGLTSDPPSGTIKQRVN
jgi:hypothetical protein